jgi:hypothetical protein
MGEMMKEKTAEVKEETGLAGAGESTSLSNLSARPRRGNTHLSK